MIVGTASVYPDLSNEILDDESHDESWTSASSPPSANTRSHTQIYPSTRVPTYSDRCHDYRRIVNNSSTSDTSTHDPSSRFTNNDSGDEEEEDSGDDNIDRINNRHYMTHNKRHEYTSSSRTFGEENRVLRKRINDNISPNLEYHNRNVRNNNKNSRNKFKTLGHSCIPFSYSHMLYALCFVFSLCGLLLVLLFGYFGVDNFFKSPSEQTTKFEDLTIAAIKADSSQPWDILLPSLESSLVYREYPSVILMGYTSSSLKQFQLSAIQIATLVEKLNDRPYSDDVFIRTTTIVQDIDLHISFNRIFANHHVVILDDISILSHAHRNSIHAHCDGPQSPYKDVVYLLGVKLPTTTIKETEDIEMHLKNVWLENEDDLQTFIMPLLSRIASNIVIIK